MLGAILSIVKTKEGNIAHGGIGFREGKREKLLLTNQADMQWFRAVRQNRRLLAGNRTFLSLPVIVLNSLESPLVYSNTPRGAKEAILSQLTPESNNLLIGGATTFKAFQEEIDYLVVTEFTGLPKNFEEVLGQKVAKDSAEVVYCPEYLDLLAKHKGQEVGMWKRKGLNIFCPALGQWFVGDVAAYVVNLRLSEESFQAVCEGLRERKTRGEIFA